MYILLGDPIPLARARIGKYKMYDSQKNLRVTNSITIESQRGNTQIYENIPLILVASFFMAIPKSSSKKRQLSLDGTPHTSKPDNSNLTKWIEDVANTILYNDDRIITHSCTRKVYSFNPRTEFDVIPYTSDKQFYKIVLELYGLCEKKHKTRTVEI